MFMFAARPSGSVLGDARAADLNVRATNDSCKSLPEGPAKPSGCSPDPDGRAQATTTGEPADAEVPGPSGPSAA